MEHLLYMKDKKYLLEFIKNLSERNYSKAEGSLQLAINEKLKNRIRTNLKKKDSDTN